jgi:hypothetical protein
MKILEGYEAKPRLASTDFEIDDGRTTTRSDEALTMPIEKSLQRSVADQSSAITTNRGKMCIPATATTVLSPELN